MCIEYQCSPPSDLGGLCALQPCHSKCGPTEQQHPRHLRARSMCRMPGPILMCLISYFNKIPRSFLCTEESEMSCFGRLCSSHLEPSHSPWSEAIPGPSGWSTQSLGPSSSKPHPGKLWSWNFLPRRHKYASGPVCISFPGMTLEGWLYNKCAHPLTRETVQRCLFP